MSSTFTKSTARNIFYGGATFFFLLFLALTFDVYKRFGNSTEAIKGFIKSRPVDGIPGRRSMPQFNLTEQELEDMAQFLKYMSEINTNNWPPNVQG